MDAAERLHFHPLTFVDEGGEIVIGRADIDSFAVFPPDAAGAVRQLQRGEPVHRVSEWYQETYGEAADIPDLVETLRELEFLRDPGQPEPVAVQVRGRRLGRLVFAPPAWLLYALLVAAAGWLAVTTPQLRPTPDRVFFSGSLVLVEVVISLGQLAGVAGHEAFHVLAGRRLGLPSRLSVGRRLTFFVFETTLTGLMGVPRNKRILPFCAGLVADALFFALLIGVGEADLLAHARVTVIGAAACGLAYVTLLRMLWQAMIFMETDLYHVVAALLRCPDLHALTRAHLGNLLWRRLGRDDRVVDESGWTERDRRLARGYAPFVVLGAVLVIGSTIRGVLPLLTGFLVRLGHGIATGGLADPHFWDSAVAAAITFGQFGLVAVPALRERRARARRSR